MITIFTNTGMSTVLKIEEKKTIKVDYCKIIFSLIVAEQYVDHVNIADILNMF